jgi:23S rRNA A2030 N6-methylase RlmJ
MMIVNAPWGLEDELARLGEKFAAR